MSTNYYWHKIETCKTCNNAAPIQDPIHIGKRSSGWTFQFRLYDTEEEGPTTISSWLARIGIFEGFIQDEYKNTITLEDFYLNLLLDGLDPTNKPLFKAAGNHAVNCKFAASRSEFC